MDFAPYIASLQDRIKRLEEDFARMITEEHEREERMEEKHALLRRERERFHEEIRTTEKQLMALMKETEQLVHAFKTATRQKEFSRLKQRVEAWKGERFLTRHELKRMIGDAP